MSDTMQTIQRQQSNDRAEALSLRGQAAQLRQKAVGVDGNDGNGYVYEEQAKDMERRADQLDEQAEKADQMFEALQRQINDLQDEREKLERDTEAKLKEIDRKIMALRGGSVALM